jgi:galactonate dehydratase
MPHCHDRRRHLHGGQLQAASAVQGCTGHEYQHSIFDPNLHLTQPTGTRHMGCAAGRYTLPDGPGLGVEPSAALFERVVG